jgi:type II secretory pathway pseudopilin PulG
MRARARERLRQHRAFTLIDVLVSLSIILVLIAIIAPSMGQVREASRRVVCASNIRQLGLGIAMYAEDNRGDFPTSVFCSPAMGGQIQNTVVVRIGTDPSAWDGLGLLFLHEYTPAPGVYYCPSHSGSHQFQRYASNWPAGRAGELVCNFQYRGVGSNGERLTLFASPAVAMVADGMRTIADYNHKVGCNLMRVDLSVSWFSDPASQLARALPISEFDTQAADKVGAAWDTLDDPSRR